MGTGMMNKRAIFVRRSLRNYDRLYGLKESAEQSLFYRNDKTEESPGSIGQGAR
jgi:hypothetical protein